MRSRPLLTLLVLLVGTTAFAEGERDYFPLTVGRSWNYSYTKSRTVISGPEKSVEKRAGAIQDDVTRISTDFQPAGQVFVVERKLLERDEAGKETKVRAELHYSVDDGGVHLHGQSSAGVAGKSGALKTYSPAQLVLKLPLSSMPKPTSPTDPAATFRFDPVPRSQSVETITVKAGTFTDCLKIEFSGPISGSLPNGIAIKSGTASQIGWYAKGIGIVKISETRTLELVSPDGTETSSTEVKEQELIGYVKGP